MNAINGVGATRRAELPDEAPAQAVSKSNEAAEGPMEAARSAVAMAGSHGLSIALLATALGAALGGAAQAGGAGAAGADGTSGGVAGGANAAASGGANAAASGGGASGTAAPEGYAALDGARNGQMLRAGASGASVTALQKALAKAGCDVPATGTFDAATSAAVLKFQQQQGIGVDGIVGPETMGALDRALGLGAPAPAPTPPTSPTTPTAPTAPTTPARPGGSGPSGPTGPGPSGPPTPAPTPPAPTGPSTPTPSGASTGDARLPGSSPAKGTNLPLPAGYGRIKGNPSKDVVAKANELLKKQEYPIGTHIPITIDGREYLFAVEWHKHAQTDNVSANLKDWHRGISVYERK